MLQRDGAIFRKSALRHGEAPLIRGLLSCCRRCFLWFAEVQQIRDPLLMLIVGVDIFLRRPEITMAHL